MRKECIEQFKEYLKREEKAGTTISKYVHDVNEMLVFMSHMELNTTLQLFKKKKYRTGHFGV